MITVQHHHIAASKAQDFDVCADANDLESFGLGEARMGTLHLHFVIKGVLRNYHGLSSILTAAGIFGRPGMVKTAPVSGTTKRAPAERRTSRT